MKRINSFILLLSLISVAAFAKNFEKVQSYQIGPGTRYSYYEEKTMPWTLHVTEVDLLNPYIKLETITSYDRIGGREKTSSMSKRSDREGHRIVSAINGDFCDPSTGIANNTQVSNGEFVEAYSYWHSAFVYSKNRLAAMTYPSFSGAIVSSENSLYPLTSVNRERPANSIVIYNSFIGNTTGTNSLGFERLAHAITDWVVNDTVFCVIESDSSFAGNMTIPSGKIILSGHGTGHDFLLDDCQPGDTIKVVQQLIGSLPAITELVGGGPRMLENGVDICDAACMREGWPTTFASDRHPRTAIGYNADSTKVYFVVVDGRQSLSIGINLYDLSDFMLGLGVKDAINLDGGGSSTMIVRNSIMNSPSDGDERIISNAVMCVSSAPNGAFTHIQIGYDSIAVYKNKSEYIGISGWDEYYNPTSIPDWSQLTINYNSSLGTFESNTFTANEEDGDTYLTADYNGDKDSVLIHIIELYDLSLYPETVTIDSVNSVKFQVSAMNESGGSRPYDNNIFEFSILDPSLASIDEEGNIKGINTGTTKVIVRYGTQTDTADVNIEIGEGEVVVDEIESTGDWTISGDSYINMSETNLVLTDRVTASGTKAFQIDYSRTGTEDGNIYIETAPIDLYGVPSDILVDVLADSNKNWIYAVLEDARGVEYSVKSASSLRYNDEYRTQYLDMESMLPADGEQLYPMQLTGLRLRIDDKATTGSMYVDRIRVIYPTWTAIGDNTNNMLPTEYCLYQNYPNPFNPLTKISYEIAKAGQVNLSVYDITGNKVATLMQGYQNAGTYNVEFSADKLSTGVYFYRLRAGNWVDTKKMLIIK